MALVFYLTRRKVYCPLQRCSTFRHSSQLDHCRAEVAMCSIQVRLEQDCLMTRGHGLGEATLVVQRSTEIAMCYSKVGFDAESVALRSDSFIKLVLLAQRRAQIGMSLCKVPIDVSGLPIFADRFVEAPALVQ